MFPLFLFLNHLLTKFDSSKYVKTTFFKMFSLNAKFTDTGALTVIIGEEGFVVLQYSKFYEGTDYFFIELTFMVSAC